MPPVGRAARKGGDATGTATLGFEAGCFTFFNNVVVRRRKIFLYLSTTIYPDTPPARAVGVRARSVCVCETRWLIFFFFSLGGSFGLRCCCSVVVVGRVVVGFYVYMYVVWCVVGQKKKMFVFWSFLVKINHLRKASPVLRVVASEVHAKVAAVQARLPRRAADEDEDGDGDGDGDDAGLESLEKTLKG